MHYIIGLSIHLHACIHTCVCLYLGLHPGIGILDRLAVDLFTCEQLHVESRRSILQCVCNALNMEYSTVQRRKDLSELPLYSRGYRFDLLCGVDLC